MAMLIAVASHAQHTWQVDDGAGHYTILTGQTTNALDNFILPPGGGTILTTGAGGTALWLTNGNTLSGGEKFGSLNGFDVVMYANNAEKLRLVNGGGVTISGGLRLNGLPAGVAKVDGTGAIFSGLIAASDISPSGSAIGQVLTSLGAVTAWSNPSAVPTGAAGGDLSGTYPNPTIANGAVTTAKINTAGAGIGNVLTYNGTNVVWSAAQSGPPTGSAGGALSGSYPNPTIAVGGSSGYVLTNSNGVATWAAAPSFVSVYGGSTGGNSISGNYYCPNGISSTTNESDIQIVCPRNGTIQNLFVNCSAPPAFPGTAKIVTVRVNFTNTALAVTVTTNNFSGNNTGTSIPVSAGDLISVTVTDVNFPPFSPLASTVQWGFELH